MGRKGHPEAIPASQAAAQILTFLSQHAPHSTILKPLVARTPGQPAPRRHSPLFPRRPRALPAGFRAEAGGVGVGGLGFSVQESVIVVLGQRKLFQIHLPHGPEVREGIPDIQSLLDPRNATKPGAGCLAGFGSSILRRGGLAPLPSFCVPTKKKGGGRVPPRQKQRCFGPNNEYGQLRSSARVGLHRVSPDKNSERNFLGRSGLDIWCPVPPGDKVAFLVAQPRRVPLTSQCQAWRATQLENSKEKARGLISLPSFALAIAPWEGKVAAVGLQL